MLNFWLPVCFEGVMEHESGFQIYTNAGGWNTVQLILIVSTLAGSWNFFFKVIDLSIHCADCVFACMQCPIMVYRQTF